MNENGKVVPQEVKGWNWGAFMFNWIWGIANKTYLPLLIFIPVLNIVWAFIVGFKGNEWAWQKGNYKDVETFKAVQKTWNIAGIVKFIAYIIFIVIYFIIFIAIFAGSTSSYTY